MMYHLEFGLDGGNCSGADAPAPCCSESFALDLVSSLISVLCKVVEYIINAVPQQVIHNGEVRAEYSHGDNHYNRCSANFFRGGARDMPHFIAHIAQKTAGARGKRLQFRPNALAFVTGCYCRLRHANPTFLYGPSQFRLRPLILKFWQGRRDSNPQVRFWRPAV